MPLPAAAARGTRLSGQQVDVPLAIALTPYVTVGQLRSVKGGRAEGPTEWFPPPKLLLDTPSGDLLIASVSRDAAAGHQAVFVPLEQYIFERARLFVDAFNALSEPPANRTPKSGD